MRSDSNNVSYRDSKALDTRISKGLVKSYRDQKPDATFDDAKIGGKQEAVRLARMRYVLL